LSVIGVLILSATILDILKQYDAKKAILIENLEDKSKSADNSIINEKLDSAVKSKRQGRFKFSNLAG
jgi:hypothetical protein